MTLRRIVGNSSAVRRFFIACSLLLPLSCLGGVAPARGFDDSSATARHYDWSKLYDRESRTAPDQVLVDWLKAIEGDPRMSVPHRYAVDLGCGEGKYTALLLKHDWRVLAIDSSHDSIDRVLKHPEADKYKIRLELRETPITETQWHDAALIFARSVLPYLSTREFPPVWNKIRNTLIPGGYFVGTLFGDGMDTDDSLPAAQRFSKAQVATMFKGFDLLKLQEVRYQQTNDSGKPVRVHLIYFLARRSLHG